MRIVKTRLVEMLPTVSVFLECGTLFRTAELRLASLSTVGRWVDSLLFRQC